MSKFEVLKPKTSHLKINSCCLCNQEFIKGNLPIKVSGIIEVNVEGKKMLTDYCFNMCGNCKTKYKF